MMTFSQNTSMTIKQGIKVLFEMVILYFTIDFPFRRRKHIEPSLIAHNMNWFTNCTWIDQLIAFKQIDYYTVK